MNEVRFGLLNLVRVAQSFPATPRIMAALGRVIRDPGAGLQDVTVHLKQGISADLAGTARVVTDPAERRPLLERAAANWGRTDVDVMMIHSPLIEVVIPGFPA